MAEFELYKQGTTKLVMNVDVVGAAFGNNNAWFDDSGAFLGDETDSWGEFGVEPRLSGETAAGPGTLFGQVSGVYTATAGDDASGLTIGLDDPDDLKLEQGHVGWKVDDVFAGLEEDTFSITGGRQDYSIGSGLLIADGGGDGGERGGWYIGMRKAFQESVIARLKSKDFLVEGFRVKNRPRRGGTHGEAYGGNFEYTVAGAATLGATYMSVDPEIPDIDILNVFSGRLDWQLPLGFGVAGEYVYEDNDQIEAEGWYAQGSYAPPGVKWAPAFSYRYAHFDGDDPTTAKDERFREVAYGFTDYGTWFQGEITGNYPLGNNNLNSHLFRIKAQPNDAVTLNFLYYNFTLDEPGSLAPGVTDDDWGDEIDFAIDWAVNDEVYLIGVVGTLFPGQAAKQFTGGEDDWVYTMLYASYAW